MKKLFLLLVILFSSNGFACSCDVKPTIKQAYTDSEEVFIAKIIGVDSSHFSSGRKIYLYNVKIARFYKKGSLYSKGIINLNEGIRTFFSQNYPGKCDFRFFLNKEYLIYEAKTTYSEGSVLNYASICSRTKLLSDTTKEELQELQQLAPADINKDDIQVDYKFDVSEQKHQTPEKQSMKANDLALKTTYLIAISSLLLVLCLIFIFLYIKTKKKLRLTNKS